MNGNETVGKVVRIAGPVIRAVGLERVRLYDVVHVGELGLIGEVIRLAGGVTTVQVYEDTSGIRVGEPVRGTGLPLVAHLGPGLLGQPMGCHGPVRGRAVQRICAAQSRCLPDPVDWSACPCRLPICR